MNWDQIVNVFVQQGEKNVTVSAVLKEHIVPESVMRQFVKPVMQRWKNGMKAKVTVSVKPVGISVTEFVAQVIRFVREQVQKLFLS